MKSFHIDRNMKDKVKIRLAIEKVCKSKKKRNGRPTKKYRQAQKILANIDRYTDLIHTIVCETEEKEQAIKSGTYRDGDFPNAFAPHISGSFTRKCENGKVRVITSVPVFPDQIIHQLVIKSAESVFMRGMYRFSCGSIPKRGVHKGEAILGTLYRQKQARQCNQICGAVRHPEMLPAYSARCFEGNVASKIPWQSVPLVLLLYYRQLQRKECIRRWASNRLLYFAVVLQFSFDTA